MSELLRVIEQGMRRGGKGAGDPPLGVEPWTGSAGATETHDAVERAGREAGRRGDRRWV